MLCFFTISGLTTSNYNELGEIYKNLKGQGKSCYFQYMCIREKQMYQDFGCESDELFLDHVLLQILRFWHSHAINLEARSQVLTKRLNSLLALYSRQNFLFLIRFGEEKLFLELVSYFVTCSLIYFARFSVMQLIPCSLSAPTPLVPLYIG